MIKGVIFDLDDTLTIHEDLYNKNYLKTICKFFPDLKIPNEEVLQIIISVVDKIGTKKYFKKNLINIFEKKNEILGRI